MNIVEIDFPNLQFLCKYCALFRSEPECYEDYENIKECDEFSCPYCNNIQDDD